ncbi:SNF2-related protein, partial [Clostridioides difficile]
MTAGPARILGDEPGLGKTAQLVVAAARIGAKRSLVICPSVLLVNWEREFRMWWSLYTTAPLPNIVRTDAKYKTLS